MNNDLIIEFQKRGRGARILKKSIVGLVVLSILLMLAMVTSFTMAAAEDLSYLYSSFENDAVKAYDADDWLPKALAHAPDQALAANSYVVEIEDSASGFGTLAFEHLRALEIIGPRVAGTIQERRAGDYINRVFKEIGYAPVIQQFPAWDENGVRYQSANIIATKAGNSTVEIIVGAHYDSVDVGRGVDDNASGVGVMLEVAELVFSLETPYTIRFIAFGSEENDLDGSYYYVDQLSPAELKNIIAMVNLDSLVAGDIAYVYSDEGSNAFLRDWVLNWSAENGFPLETIHNVDLSDDGWPTADYGPFKEKGIAFAYFEATNWALGDRDGYTQVDPKYGDNGHIWHTKYDNSNYLEKAFPGRISMRLAGYSATLYAICTEFTYKIAAPPRVTLKSPANNASVAGTRVVFHWNPAAGAARYQLQIRKTSDNSPFRNRTLGNVTQRTIANFPADGTQYKWRVRAGNASGWGQWSVYRNFKNGR